MTTPPLIRFLLRLRNRHILMLDALIMVLTPIVALALRLDGLEQAIQYKLSLVIVTAAFALIKMVVFQIAGLYNQYWRYASVSELGRIGLAGSIAVALQTVVFFAILRLSGAIDPSFPRSIPLIDGLLVLPAAGLIRYSVRLAQLLNQPAPFSGSRRQVLIVGAGKSGVLIAQEIQSNPALGLVPVGFIDDDTGKYRSRIRGLRVLGGRRDISTVIDQHHVDEVIIAMPTAPGKIIREIVGVCERAGIRVKIIPSIREIIGGRISVSQLRDVQIEDLLRREPVQTDTTAVHELLRGKRVLVTGGGGSIGSELCRQILSYEPAELVVLGHGENSVFEAQNELGELNRLHGRKSVVQAIIADIRFPDRILSVFQRFQPQIVFHAAAHKHVPLMEQNPGEAISNNVLGTRNVLAAAQQTGVERFVMVSTDKAVNPTSVMGASKRVAELLVHQTAGRAKKPYVAVRFGNVLGSRGSVVLTFRRQIAAGGPITVTDPLMQRYFMTIPEAVELVLQAAVLGSGGEIFMLDMGEPVKIADLARDMIELSGLEVGRDIDIVFSGLRPGEKLFEELFVRGEEYEPTLHEKVFIARNATNALTAGLDNGLARLEAAAREDDQDTIFELLQQLVPEYQRPAPATTTVVR